MADIFISYAHEDRPFVRRMVPALEREGFSVWWDHTIPPGQSWDSFIARGIKEAKAAIVVWSKTSSVSEWVKEEATLSRETGKYLPVQIDGTPPPIGFSRIQSAQLTGWDGNARDPQWSMLVAEVRRIMAADGSPATHAPPRQPQPLRTQQKKSLPIAAILVGLLVVAGAGAAGYWYLQQGGGQSAAATTTAQAAPPPAPAAQANPPAPQPAAQDVKPDTSDDQLSELKKQMADTQAALAEERRLREEEADKAAKLRAAEKAREARVPQPVAVASPPAASPPPAPSAPSVEGTWQTKLTWGNGTDNRTGTAVFNADKSVRFNAGSLLSLGTWVQTGQIVTASTVESVGTTTFNCTISGNGMTCSASFSNRPDLAGKLVMTR